MNTTTKKGGRPKGENRVRLGTTVSPQTRANIVEIAEIWGYDGSKFVGQVIDKCVELTLKDLHARNEAILKGMIGVQND